MAREPWSARACDGLVWAYAGYTLVCHAVVFLGGGANALGGAVLAAGLVAAVVFTRRRVRRLVFPPAASALGTDGADEPPGPAPLLALAGGALVLGVLLATGSVVLTWWAAVVVLALAFALHLRAADAPQPEPLVTRWREPVLWGLAIAGALLTQIVQRPDIDDAYYVNVAAAMVDHPAAPLLRFDTIYGIPGLPLMLPIYRLHSFELLGGLIARFSPLAAIQACHLVVPALFGLFVPLALARLFRVLRPRDWFWGVLATCVLLATTAESHRWYGNFAFVRLQHGKGVFLTALVPLLIVYAFEFARAPSLPRWLRLCAAQVAALGMTATSLWAAPVVAGLTLVASVPLSLRGAGRVVVGALASGYLVALGLAFRASTAAIVTHLPLPDADMPARGDGPALVRWAFVLSNGEGRLAAACVVALVAGWGFCRSAPARRLVAGVSLAFLLLLLDPYVAQRVADGVTSTMTYFRVFWATPLPVLLALLLLAPLSLPRLPAPVRLTLAAAGTSLFLLYVPERFVLSPENLARVEPFGLKVYPDEYRAARLLVQNVPADATVAASQFVAVYVGMLPHHPALISSRLDYLEFLPGVVDDIELEQRRFLGMTLLQPQWLLVPERQQVFEQLLERFHLKGVAFPVVDRVIPRLLAGHGFHSVGRTEHYSVWVRP